MTVVFFEPALSPFASDPFYALGLADAYDESIAGESIDSLKRRAGELLDAEVGDSMPAELYRMGYTQGVIGIANGHIATVNAQCEVAQTWLARKQGRETSPLHAAVRGSRQSSRIRRSYR